MEQDRRGSHEVKFALKLDPGNETSATTLEHVMGRAPAVRQALSTPVGVNASPANKVDDT
jgi:hypothetical protein